MAKYIYPALFTPEKEGGYSVEFPDIDGCYTCGDDLDQSLYMAADALALMLTEYEDEKKTIPAASDIRKVTTNGNQFVSLVSCDTDQYRRLLNNKAVKKTLSIPEWLNAKAIAAGINFSQTLQDALIEKLGA